MNMQTWQAAPTRSVDVNGTKFVYRRLGPGTGVPVILLNHLAAELDSWDPRVVDGISAVRRVIGDDDKMVPTSNSVDMARRLPDAELVIYDDAGHGGIVQYHEAFVKKALEFLKDRGRSTEVGSYARSRIDYFRFR